MTITLTKPAPAGPAASDARHAPEPGCLAAVSLSGQLRLPPAGAVASTSAMSRRTRTGTVYRVDLDGGITCWLDGDHQDGSGQLNWVATAMCATLSGGTFTDPWDAPFVCGPVLFTATATSGPVALSDEQLRRVVDAHAAAASTARARRPSSRPRNRRQR
jgi:hypothetical protein